MHDAAIGGVQLSVPEIERVLRVDTQTGSSADDMYAVPRQQHELQQHWPLG